MSILGSLILRNYFCLLGFRVQASGLRAWVEGVGLRAEALGFRVWGLGLRVQDQQVLGCGALRSCFEAFFHEG